MEFIHNVSSDLLISILVLTDYRTISRCRAVCKRWNSLLTNPQINGAFALHYRNPKHHNHHRPKITFLIENRTIVPSHYDMYYQWEFYQTHYVRPQFLELSYGDNTLTQTPPSFLNFLPDPSVRVRASLNDLLLVSSSPVNYYLFNHQTRQSVSLPEAPNAGATPVGYGLVSKSKTIRVVLFHTACLAANGREYRYMVSVFAWETWSWSRSLSPAWPVTAEEHAAYSNFSKEKGGTDGVVSCNRGLYWHNVWPDRVTSILRFDPYSRRWGLCSFLPRWNQPLYTNKKKFIGKCCGQVRYCSLSFKPPNTLCFVVWRVGGDDDDETRLSDSSKWYLLHVNPDIQVADHVHEPNIVGVSFHPSDQHVVFFYDVNHVFRYDMSSKKLHQVAEMPIGVNAATQQLSAFTIDYNPLPTCWMKNDKECHPS